ncbi:hypothetical protein EMCG_00648 [[Emmonsia] crescens]|uniref:Uncharacterized protein n=1 Tax=[Emmonsia] crescens TaxID=73230 RepID=A0A0G2IZ04_9EURO|nr:hypothetical protein EMCG_00648 [Emmonsia crescens UAMH 3008]
MFTATKAIQMVYKGTPIERLTVEAGVNYFNTIKTASGDIEKKYPRVAYAKIQGTTLHTSSKDKSDLKKVVTVGYHTNNGTRLLSIHAHDDGTWTEFFSRPGKPEAAISASLGDSSNPEQPKK